MSKEQVLATLEDRFTEGQLEKLLTIGESILSPMDGELTSVDFAAMVDSVFKADGLADTYFPQWTDRSSSDMGRLLVEIFAIFSDKDFFYINNFSREAFVGTANLYSSLRARALNQGFNPSANVAATGNISMVFSSGEAQTVSRGDIVLGVTDFPSPISPKYPPPVIYSTK